MLTPREVRVVSVPGSLNAESGLICLHVGDRRDLERIKIRDLVERSKPTPYIWSLRFERAIQGDETNA